MSDTPAATVLADRVLSNRLVLPVKMNSISLLGSNIRLEPLDVARDSRALFSVSNGSGIEINGTKVAEYDSDAIIWRYYGCWTTR